MPNEIKPIISKIKNKVMAKVKVKVRKRGEAITLISAHAKKIWNKEKGEKWTDAIKRASAELKKLKKI